MKFEEIHGNLFDSITQVIAHGCNCQGIMGAGVALQIKRQFPEVYLEYHNECKCGYFNLGSCLIKESEGRVIANLGTQMYCGPDARISAITESLLRLRVLMEDNGWFSVAMPRIGCGLGGLLWSDVKKVIKNAFTSTDIEVFIYKL